MGDGKVTTGITGL